MQRHPGRGRALVATTCASGLRGRVNAGVRDTPTTARTEMRGAAKALPASAFGAPAGRRI